MSRSKWVRQTGWRGVVPRGEGDDGGDGGTGVWGGEVMDDGMVAQGREEVMRRWTSPAAPPLHVFSVRRRDPADTDRQQRPTRRRTLMHGQPAPLSEPAISQPASQVGRAHLVPNTLPGPL